ncbi:Gfo/Idh/MocA family oxidoreductase [Thalassotalea sp. M1531]|uniref:Gfo/Idh/MocA family oxidoreductase n=1 Tax=Thalassotalea algicola TaxID=2716224 RepID=A0A7Y0LGL4_9GAMM|nr:Gfo/Idh/MocA family oxidoreductase [Thalassotalea algicola]NMP32845.1 Gfo/Idh/MocA family oxidoreductase [Thalassotalea algicola]
MNKLNWGIVSTGRIAEQFASDMAFVSNGKMLAVAARKLEDAEEFASRFEIERAYASYQAMFDDPDIDVVYIGTPHTLHFDQARDAILAGKHVLCEKPVTISSAQCQELSKLAKSQGVFLMEAMWTYFLPAIQQAKRWVDAGRIGNLKHVKADFGYPMPYSPETRVYNKALAGGCLLDMGIYPIAIAGYFLNNVNADWYVSAEFAPNGVENDVIMLADFGGKKATLATSFQCKLNNYAYIIGDKGYIAIHDFWRAKDCSLYILEEEVEHFEDSRDSIGLNYEAQAVAEDIFAGKLESDVVTHGKSLWLQTQMENVKSLFDRN